MVLEDSSEIQAEEAKQKIEQSLQAGKRKEEGEENQEKEQVSINEIVIDPQKMSQFLETCSIRVKEEPSNQDNDNKQKQDDLKSGKKEQEQLEAIKGGFIEAAPKPKCNEMLKQFSNQYKGQVWQNMTKHFCCTKCQNNDAYTNNNDNYDHQEQDNIDNLLRKQVALVAADVSAAAVSNIQINSACLMRHKPLVDYLISTARFDKTCHQLLDYLYNQFNSVLLKEKEKEEQERLQLQSQEVRDLSSSLCLNNEDDLKGCTKIELNNNNNLDGLKVRNTKTRKEPIFSVELFTNEIRNALELISNERDNSKKFSNKQTEATTTLLTSNNNNNNNNNNNDDSKAVTTKRLSSKQEAEIQRNVLLLAARRYNLNPFLIDSCAANKQLAGHNSSNGNKTCSSNQSERFISSESAGSGIRIRGGRRRKQQEDDPLMMMDGVQNQKSVTPHISIEGDVCNYKTTSEITTEMTSSHTKSKNEEEEENHCSLANYINLDDFDLFKQQQQHHLVRPLKSSSYSALQPVDSVDNGSHYSIENRLNRNLIEGGEEQGERHIQQQVDGAIKSLAGNTTTTSTITTTTKETKATSPPSNVALPTSNVAATLSKSSNNKPFTSFKSSSQCSPSASLDSNEGTISDHSATSSGVSTAPLVSSTNGSLNSHSPLSSTSSQSSVSSTASINSSSHSNNNNNNNNNNNINHRDQLSNSDFGHPNHYQHPQHHSVGTKLINPIIINASSSPSTSPISVLQYHRQQQQQHQRRLSNEQQKHINSIAATLERRQRVQPITELSVVDLLSAADQNQNLPTVTSRTAISAMGTLSASQVIAVGANLTGRGPPPQQTALSNREQQQRDGFEQLINHFEMNKNVQQQHRKAPIKPPFSKGPSNQESFFFELAQRLPKPSSQIQRQQQSEITNKSSLQTIGIDNTIEPTIPMPITMPLDTNGLPIVCESDDAPQQQAKTLPITPTSNPIRTITDHYSTVNKATKLSTIQRQQRQQQQQQVADASVPPPTITTTIAQDLKSSESNRRNFFAITSPLFGCQTGAEVPTSSEMQQKKNINNKQQPSRPTSSLSVLTTHTPLDYQRQQMESTNRLQSSFSASSLDQHHKQQQDDCSLFVLSQQAAAQPPNPEMSWRDSTLINNTHLLLQPTSEASAAGNNQPQQEQRALTKPAKSVSFDPTVKDPPGSFGNSMTLGRSSTLKSALKSNSSYWSQQQQQQQQHQQFAYNQQFLMGTPSGSATMPSSLANHLKSGHSFAAYSAYYDEYGRRIRLSSLMDPKFAPQNQQQELSLPPPATTNDDLSKSNKSLLSGALSKLNLSGSQSSRGGRRELRNQQQQLQQQQQQLTIQTQPMPNLSLQQLFVQPLDIHNQTSNELEPSLFMEPMPSTSGLSMQQEPQNRRSSHHHNRTQQRHSIEQQQQQNHRYSTKSRCNNRRDRAYHSSKRSSRQHDNKRRRFNREERRRGRRRRGYFCNEENCYDCNSEMSSRCSKCSSSSDDEDDVQDYSDSDSETLSDTSSISSRTSYSSYSSASSTKSAYSTTSSSGGSSSAGSSTPNSSRSSSPSSSSVCSSSRSTSPSPSESSIYHQQESAILKQNTDDINSSTSATIGTDTGNQASPINKHHGNNKAPSSRHKTYRSSNQYSKRGEKNNKSREYDKRRSRRGRSRGSRRRKKSSSCSSSSSNKYHKHSGRFKDKRSSGSSSRSSRRGSARQSSGDGNRNKSERHRSERSSASRSNKYYDTQSKRRSSSSSSINNNNNKHNHHHRRSSSSTSLVEHLQPEQPPQSLVVGPMMVPQQQTLLMQHQPPPSVPLADDRIHFENRAKSPTSVSNDSKLANNENCRII